MYLNVDIVGAVSSQVNYRNLLAIHTQLSSAEHVYTNSFMLSIMCGVLLIVWIVYR